MFEIYRDAALHAHPDVFGAIREGRRLLQPDRRGDPARRPGPCSRKPADASPGFANDQAIIDPGIAPVGSDCEGQLKRVLESVALIHSDAFFAGVHMSVGLSNFTVMLPPKRADGSPVKGPLESAFLTMAMPLGLDMIIGSMVRKYEILPEGHPALVCLQDILKLDGYDTLMRLKEFYA